MTILEEELQERMLEFFKIRYPSKKEVKVSNFVKITEGWETEVYSFVLEDRSNNKLHLNDLILRIYPGDNAKKKSAKEFKVMAKLYEVGFPVPRVYYLETGQSTFGKPFVIMEKITGQSMGEIIKVSSEKTKKDMNSMFCKMFVDLHRLDIEPFVSVSSIALDPISVYDVKNPYDYITYLLEHFRHILTRFEKVPREVEQAMNWLESRKQDVPSERSSLVHLDYHPYNVLIRKNDGAPFVIDWTNTAITDYRVDLAWTLLLASTYGNPDMRDYILKTYEKIAGSKVENIEYFEVIAATRRLGSIYLSLNEGAEKMGMRPEAVEIMKQQTEHIKAIIRVLRDRTGIAISEKDELLRL